ncbi:hypothetical protein FDP41_008560 [Naegleria fowleri]|uniref:Uncharacterized protein n=1 Tax=Naegleria fowleri TaxID=5763 RepID=A0A6A5B2M5_NAEFO|nr:uncharacterized protein FDP41_008560 [Naegleria fowleri]KAF0973353.1 hypothetical protein FDP41_008560 [Naegleria fowleri]CAG4710939.1 unnamed protein product [Naegleria fowleri]
MDWSNVFVAGGSFLLCSRANASIRSEEGASRYLHSCLKYDIDLFLYALTQEDAENKIRHIYSIIKKNVKGKNILVTRTKFAITFSVRDYPQVQVVTRIYKSPAETLIGFDIDSCCIGYDGNKVWALPRFARALSKRYNLVDVERMSTTYERRLRKYAARGFSVLVPGYKKSLVKRPGLLGNYGHCHEKELSGLALLLYYESGPSRNYGHQPALSSDEDELLNENHEDETAKSDYGDFLCYQMLMGFNFPHMIRMYEKYLKRRKTRFVASLNDVEKIINSTLLPNHDITLLAFIGLLNNLGRN